MERKHLFLLLGSTLCVAAILAVIYVKSPLNNGGIRPAGFSRNFLADSSIVERARLDLGYNSYYIAGADLARIYLANHTAPFHILVANRTLTDTSRQRITLVGLDSVRAPRRFRTVVDSPFVFLSHGVLPGIFRGVLDEWEVARFMWDDAFFIQTVPVGANSFILLSNSAETNEYALAKQTIDSPYFRFENSLLEKQIDGRFCVDGKLHYVRALNRVVYLYYYRNEFVVADTNLNLCYRGTTIDTFSRAQIRVADVGNGKSMLSAPPLSINGLSCVSDRCLYVQSNLLADNGDQERFLAEFVIDVYDLTSGSYQHSFYLPHDGGKLHDFGVFEGQLIALIGNEILMYQLNSDET